jgi:multicomponent K+:H+ antiporter subunit G
MIAIEPITIWLALPVGVLLIVGGSISLVGALGLLRLPTFYKRMHGPAITVTLGSGCMLIASMLYFTGLQSRPVIHEVLVTAFVLMTAPVSSMLILRAAVYHDLRAGKRDSGVESGDIYERRRGTDLDRSQLESTK